MGSAVARLSRGRVHILDDFLYLVKTRKRCAESLELFLEFCSLVGVPMPDKNLFQPNQVMVFVAITLDSNAMEVRLPLDKDQKYYSLLNIFGANCAKNVKWNRSWLFELHLFSSSSWSGNPYLRS